MRTIIFSICLIISIISCGGNSDETMSSLSIKYDAKKINMYDFLYSIDFQKVLTNKRIIFKAIIEDIYLMNDTIILKCYMNNPNLDVYGFILSKKQIDYKYIVFKKPIYIVADIYEVIPCESTYWDIGGENYYPYSCVRIRGYLADYFQ